MTKIEEPQEDDLSSSAGDSLEMKSIHSQDAPPRLPNHRHDETRKDSSHPDFDIMSNLVFSRAQVVHPGIAQEWDSTWESLYTLDDDTIYTTLTKQEVVFEGMPTPKPPDDMSATLHQYADAHGLKEDDLMEMMQMMVAQNEIKEALKKSSSGMEEGESVLSEAAKCDKSKGGEIQLPAMEHGGDQNANEHVTLPPWMENRDKATKGGSQEPAQEHVEGEVKPISLEKDSKDEPASESNQVSKPEEKFDQAVPKEAEESKTPELKTEASATEPLKIESSNEDQRGPSDETKMRGATSTESTAEVALPAESGDSQPTEDAEPADSASPDDGNITSSTVPDEVQPQQEARRRKWFLFWLFHNKKRTMLSWRPKKGKRIQSLFYTPRTRPGEFLKTSSHRDRCARANATHSVSASSDHTLDESFSSSQVGEEHDCSNSSLFVCPRLDPVLESNSCEC